MRKNSIKKNYVVVGALLFICSICMLFVATQMSLANEGVSEPSDVESQEIEFTDENNVESQELEADENLPSNDKTRWLAFGGSGIGGKFTDPVVDYDFIMKSATDKEEYGLGAYWDIDDQGKKKDIHVCICSHRDGKFYIEKDNIYNRDKYGRFDGAILWGPAKITEEGIQQARIDIFNNETEMTNAVISDEKYWFTYGEYEFETKSGSGKFYNFIELEVTGENIFGGFIGGKKGVPGYEKIEVTFHKFNDKGWDSFTLDYQIKEIINKLYPDQPEWLPESLGDLAVEIFHWVLQPDYPTYLEAYELSNTSLIKGRPWFIDNDGTIHMLITIMGGEATVDVKPYAERGYVFDHWELNGEKLTNGDSGVVPAPKHIEDEEIGGYNTYELVACCRSYLDCVVTFNSVGGSDVLPQTVHNGHTAEKPFIDPSKAGYTFAGWCTEDGSAFDFTTPITKDITLYAKWTGGPENPPVIESGDGQTYEHGSGGSLTFAFDQDKTYLRNIQVDGFIIDPKCYMANNSASAVSLSGEYLNTLYPGEHTMTFVADNGSAAATFNIHDSSYNPGGGEGGNGGNVQSITNSIAQTGDSIGVWVLIMFVVMCGAGAFVYSRSRKYTNR